MAQVSGTQSTYDIVGMREDLADAIYRISPEDTPFMSAIGTGSASSNTTHEWQTDSLAAAVGTNFHIEGNESAYTTPAATTRLGNPLAIAKKSALVSGTHMAVSLAGRGDPMAYEIGKRMAEIKLDMDTALMQDNAAVTGDDTTAREFGGLVSWLQTNTSFGTNGVDPVYTSQPTDTRSGGTARAFTETILKAVLLSCYDEGASPTMLIMPSAQKQVASAFAGIAAQRSPVTNAHEVTIAGAADFYVSDFGEIAFVPSRQAPTGSALAVDPEYAAVSYLRPFVVEDRAKTGDANKKEIIVEYTLECKNEAAHGGAFDLS